VTARKGSRRARTYVVARVDDLPDGSRMIADLDGLSVGLFHVGNRFYALLNRCPHQGAALCRGSLVGTIEAAKPGQEYRYSSDAPLLVCPWHGWEFELATGQSYFDPRRVRVRAYSVNVERGEALIDQSPAGDVRPATGLQQGPFVATTFPVTIEDDYICVSLATRPAS